VGDYALDPGDAYAGRDDAGDEPTSDLGRGRQIKDVGEMDRKQIDALAIELMQKQLALRVKKHSEVREPLSTTASSLGYVCERRIVYGRCFPKDATAYSDELLSIFEEGDLHAKNVKQELCEIGYEVVESEVRFADKRLDISGAIDGKIVVSGHDTYSQKRIPAEIKSITGQAPRTEMEIRNSENRLLRRYYSQLQTYLYLCNEEFGLFIFKDKIIGCWTVVVVQMDFSFVETLLQRAERVRDAVRLVDLAATCEEKLSLLPDRDVTRAECDGCPFYGLCLPADAPVDPLLLAQDDDLEKQIDRRAELDSGRKEFAKLDETIKARFKLTAGERFVVGAKWLVTKKTQKNGVVIKIDELGKVA
jgi:hypothetical protein